MDCRINFDGHHHLQLAIHIQARNFVGHFVVLESSWHVLGSCPDTFMRLQLSRSWGIQFFVENFCVMLALSKFCRYFNEVLRFAADNSDNSQQSCRTRNSLPTYSRLLLPWILVTAANSLLDPSHNFNLQIPHIPCEPHDLARPKTSCQTCWVTS